MAENSGKMPAPDAIAAAIAACPAPAPGLHVVATPIGNLADITLRALVVLAQADVIACEDTRHTRRLMERYGLKTQLTAYHEHNAASARPGLLKKLAEGAVVALVSDAGTPLVSDPGYKLVESVLEQGHHVEAVPGASALLAGLVVSGLPSDRFSFEGFLPTKQGRRRQRLSELSGLKETLVFYESPRRLAACLGDMEAVLGNRPAAVARELTKKFEETVRGSLSELAERYSEDGAPQGEIVLFVSGASRENALSPDEVEERLKSLIASMPVKEAAASLAAETGLSKRDLYQRALAIKQENG